MSEIDDQILNYLRKQDWPVTTEMVARHLEISWNTAQVHLYKLVAGGLVKGRKVGRQNQWMITEKGRKRQESAKESPSLQNKNSSSLI